MSGEMGWGSRGDALIAGVGIAMILSLSMRMEAAPREARDTHEATATAATPRAEQLSNVDVSDYDRLLHSYVMEEGWVDYAGLGRERGALNRFLEALGKASLTGLKDDTERLALWINSYNAFTLADALDTVYGKREGGPASGRFFQRTQASRCRRTVDAGRDRNAGPQPA